MNITLINIINIVNVINIEEARMTWKVKIYLSKHKEDWLYLVDENTLEPKVFDNRTDAQVAAHVWSSSDIEEESEDKNIHNLGR